MTAPVFFPSLAALKSANNAGGFYVFTLPGAQYHGGLWGGRFFVHSLPGDAGRRYWVAAALNNGGNVRNVGEAFTALDPAREYLHALALGAAAAGTVINPVPEAPARTANGVCVAGVELYAYLSTSCMAAHELVLNVRVMLLGKMARGTFDPARLRDAYKPVVMLAAREYAREYGGREYGHPFRPAARSVALSELVEYECIEFNVNRWGAADLFLNDVPGAELMPAPAAALEVAL